jgi:hypothetical protein
MKTLTWEQAAEWTNSVGIMAAVDRVVEEYVTENGQKQSTSRINQSIYFQDEDPELRLTLPLPSKPFQVAYLANALLPYSNAAEFQPCLLWLTDFGFWSDVSERVAHSLTECFRSTRGEQKPLMETPAHLFDVAEAIDAQTLLTIAIVFGWDCYVIPAHANYYALTSHDDYLKVVSSDSANHSRFKQELEGWQAVKRG